MLNRVTAGAASYANPQTAFHRQDGGANALTGIRAARSAYVRRPDAADDAGSVKWQPPTGAGVTAAKRPTPAQAAIAAAAQSTAAAQAATAKIAEASGGQGAKEKIRPGLSVALDVLESSEEGRELLAKIKASDSGIDIWYNERTGRDCVYMKGFEKDYWDVYDRVTARMIAQDTADTVEISDAGRELAAQMGEANTARPVPTELRVYSMNDEDSPLPSSTIEAIATARAEARARGYDTSSGINLTPEDYFSMDGTLLNALYSKSDLDGEAVYKLSVEVGRLLKASSGTLEERVVNRAKGQELAKYIVENYIDDPAERQKVLDHVKELANVYEQRDKGYFIAMTNEGMSVIAKIDDGLLIKDGRPTEKQATDIINRAKNSLDMNAVKQDALDIFKKILANYMNADGTALAAPKWLT